MTDLAALAARFAPPDPLAPLRGFVSDNQLACVAAGLRTEEAAYFREVIDRLGERIAKMPVTYETEKQEGEPLAYLHYFHGDMDALITEKDKGDGECTEDDFQVQAFGWCQLAPGCGELGYISIRDLITNGFELDFHFEPRPLSEAIAKYKS